MIHLVLYYLLLEHEPNKYKINITTRNIPNHLKNPPQSPVFIAVPPKMQKKIIIKNII